MPTHCCWQFVYVGSGAVLVVVEEHVMTVETIVTVLVSVSVVVVVVVVVSVSV